MATGMFFGNRAREKDSVTINDKTNHKTNLANRLTVGQLQVLNNNLVAEAENF